MKVHIQNYQTVKDVSLDINGFTVIVGKSNTGKTALLRAIEGAMFNDSVTKKVRVGETDTIVSIEYGGIHWTWKKGENFNDYIITTDKGTKEYSRVGFNPPAEIVEAGFKEWLVDREKMRPQIAAWHDSIFLLNKGGTAITELMTAVTRLDVINLAIRNCSSEQRKLKSIIKVREKDFQKAKQEVQEFDPLRTIEVSYIDSLYVTYQNLSSKIERLDQMCQKYALYTQYIDSLSFLDSVWIPPKMDLEPIKNVAQLEQWSKKLSDLDLYIGAMHSLDRVEIPNPINKNSNIDIVTKWVNQLEDLDKHIYNYTFPNVEIPKVDLESLQRDLTRVEKFMQGIVQIGKELKSVTLEISEVEKSIEQDSKNLASLRSQIDVCDVCGRSGV